MLKTMSKFQGMLKMFYVRHLENRVEVGENHHHTLWCVLKLSDRGPKSTQQTTGFKEYFLFQIADYSFS